MGQGRLTPILVTNVNASNQRLSLDYHVNAKLRDSSGEKGIWSRGAGRKSLKQSMALLRQGGGAGGPRGAATQIGGFGVINSLFNSTEQPLEGQTLQTLAPQPEAAGGVGGGGPLQSFIKGADSVNTFAAIIERQKILIGQKQALQRNQVSNRPQATNEAILTSIMSLIYQVNKPKPVMDTMAKVDANLVNAKQQLEGFKKAYGQQCHTAQHTQLMFFQKLQIPLSNSQLNYDFIFTLPERNKRHFEHAAIFKKKMEQAQKLVSQLERAKRGLHGELKSRTKVRKKDVF